MKQLAVAAVLVIVLWAGARAGDVHDYQRRVQEAAAHLEEISEGDEDSESGLTQVRALLPRTEQVEIDDRVITVDNAWLYSLLDAYDKSSEEQRAARLDEAMERLVALDAHLEREVNRSEDGSAAVDPRQRVKQILARPSFREKLEDPLSKKIRELRQAILDLLADVFRRAFGLLVGSGEANWFFRVLIVIAVGGALVAVVLMLKRRRSPTRKKKQPKQTILGEEIDEGATASELAAAAMSAARAGDFRAALRKLYISLLYELADHSLIELEPHATNHDYLARASRHTGLEGPMRYLTERFDHVWYGMLPSSPEDFSSCLGRYEEAVNITRSLGGQARA
jgi:hypothetical protein